jgi:hypothetical protein
MTKHLGHLYRMNPQTLRRHRLSSRLSTVLASVVVITLVALYWIGRLHH